jgi:hypothetical protein
MDEQRKPNYRDEMFDTLANAIENVGKSDESYDNYLKALDILEVLESLLAYTIYNTCDSPETIRDACEESYINIKKRALLMFENSKK